MERLSITHAMHLSRNCWKRLAPGILLGKGPELIFATSALDAILQIPHKEKGHH